MLVSRRKFNTELVSKIVSSHYGRSVITRRWSIFDISMTCRSASLFYSRCQLVLYDVVGLDHFGLVRKGFNKFRNVG